MGDKFFTQPNCDRCGGELHTRIMSWFNNDTICMDCSKKEKELRSKLRDSGRAYEGCGYIPALPLGEF